MEDEKWKEEKKEEKEYNEGLERRRRKRKRYIELKDALFVLSRKILP